MVLNQGCLWYLIMVKCCTYSVSKYFSWYQIMVALKISLFLIKVGWKSMVPNQCFKKVYGYYSVLRSGEKSVLWKILWLLIKATMVPDQCCHKINCTYSYMGLNHGTRLDQTAINFQNSSFLRKFLSIGKIVAHWRYIRGRSQTMWTARVDGWVHEMSTKVNQGRWVGQGNVNKDTN